MPVILITGLDGHGALQQPVSDTALARLETQLQTNIEKVGLGLSHKNTTIVMLADLRQSSGRGQRKVSIIVEGVHTLEKEGKTRRSELSTILRRGFCHWAREESFPWERVEVCVKRFDQYEDGCDVLTPEDTSPTEEEREL